MNNKVVYRKNSLIKLKISKNNRSSNNKKNLGMDRVSSRKWEYRLMKLNRNNKKNKTKKKMKMKKIKSEIT